MQTGPQPYGEFYLRVGDRDFYGINFEGWLANRWQGGQEILVGEVIRPSKANGYEFVCSTAGQTAADEPTWVLPIGATTNDGSAVWTCQAVGTDSLISTVANVNWVAPPGILAVEQTLVNQTASALIDATLAVLGTDYLVNVAATMADGEEKVGQLKFKVR